MPTATITTKRQITIPKEDREALGIGAGDRIEFVAEEEGVYRVVAATRDVRHLKGLVPKPAKAVSVEDMNRAAARGAARK